jgi:hypothetical protein
MADPAIITFTIALPPDTVAEVNGLIADLRAAVQKYSALADSVNAAVPPILADVNAVTAKIAKAWLP